MIRLKTDLELRETIQEQADRLRGALFAAANAKTFKEAKRICWAAMSGERYGCEPPPVKPLSEYEIFVK